MSQGDIQVGEWGFPLECVFTDQSDVVIDISSATTKQIIITKPNGVILTKTGIFSGTGTDGKLKYVTIAADLDIVGTYTYQGKVTSASWYHPSSVATFIVLANL